MGCVVSSVIKLVLQIVNTVLAVAFLVLAIIGILLRTSKEFVENILRKLLDQIGDNKDFQKIATFIQDNVGAVSIVFIAVGLVFGIICLVGCLSSCCGCGILLKVYAVVLGVLVIAEIIAVAVIFSDPEKYVNLLLMTLSNNTSNYGKPGPENEIYTATWDVLTGAFNCCGMKGFQDFNDAPSAPPVCCKSSSVPCNPGDVSAGLPGCETKLRAFFTENMQMIMYICIGIIGAQAAMLILAILAICLG